MRKTANKIILNDENSFDFWDQNVYFTLKNLFSDFSEFTDFASTFGTGPDGPVIQKFNTRLNHIVSDLEYIVNMDLAAYPNLRECMRQWTNERLLEGKFVFFS